MVKFNRNNKSKKTKKVNSKPTPFRDAGKIVGKSAAQFFGIPGFKDIGSLVGSGIGRIFGSGDYTMTGPTPSVNVLMGQIPKFSSTKATNIVCHREYIGDITGTSAFTNTSYPLNPGISTTFPWLSQIASNYSQYRFHGVVFEFRPLITDYVTSGAPGVVIMSTNYNADDAAYTTKREMENSEFAVSIKPTNNLLHMIECDPAQTSMSEQYTRQSSTLGIQDKKTYDLGTFQFATQGNPVQLLGELWVTYCVEFFKPEIPTLPVGPVASVHYSGYDASTLVTGFGTQLAVKTAGSVTATISATSFSVTGLQASTRYWFSHSCVTGAAISASPVYTVVDGTAYLGFCSSGAANFTATRASTSSTNHIAERVITSSSLGVITVTVASGVCGSGTLNSDIYLTAMSQEVNS